MSENSYDYDLLVIGSGPAGQRAAIQGAKLDKKVAIVERKTVLGGCSVNLGTIPSKTFREAALELCGYRSREFYGGLRFGKVTVAHPAGYQDPPVFQAHRGVIAPGRLHAPDRDKSRLHWIV